MKKLDLSKSYLIFGDNLDILRKYLPDESIDLIYLDPPFKSGRNYNILYRELNESDSVAQIQAFEDTWRWDANSRLAYEDIIEGDYPSKLKNLLTGMFEFLGKSEMSAYLVMMAPRLVELKRVLKSTGSIYLHCDPSASHYLKLLMDAVFGNENFRNEIIWAYRTGGSSKRNWSRKHDVLLFYSKTDKYKFNPQKEKVYTKSKSRKAGIVNYGAGTAEFFKDEKGVYNLVNARDVWEISYINSQAKERTGYPTQKPEKLLERIIKASSNKGDVVLDAFCGCGTTIAVAQKLGRRWIGIDISPIAIKITHQRLAKRNKRNSLLAGYAE